VTALSSNSELAKITRKGDNITCETGFSVFHGADNIFLGSNISLVDSLLNAGGDAGSIIIDDYVLTGHGVKILARGHDYNAFHMDRHHAVTEAPVHIKTGAWIGSGSSVLPGVTIGAHAVVGAGSIVTRDVVDYAVVAGNPAKVIIRDIRSMASPKDRLFNRVLRIFNRLGC
jgi:acetyltransferase-like isoleucine patch superfamily enzyme